MAQGLAVGWVVRCAALLDGGDVVYVGGYLTAGAEWLVEQDAAAEDLPLLAVVDLLVALVVGGGVVLSGVSVAASSVGGWVRTAWL